MSTHLPTPSGRSGAGLGAASFFRGSRGRSSGGRHHEARRRGGGQEQQEGVERLTADEQQRAERAERDHRGPEHLLRPRPDGTRPEEVDAAEPAPDRDDDAAEEEQGDGCDLAPERALDDAVTLADVGGDVERVADLLENGAHVATLVALVRYPACDIADDALANARADVPQLVLQRREVERDAIVVGTWHGAHRRSAVPPRAPKTARGRLSPAPRTSRTRGFGSYIIPPMSGMPAPAPAPAFSGASATTASVVRMFFAIDAAFCSAERVTIVGSPIPLFSRSSTSPVSTFRPKPLSAARTCSTAIEPSRPAFVASWRSGSSSERRMICAPVRSSPSSEPRTSSFTASAAFRSATPPPGTWPSSSAARAAWRASSTRCFFSFISVSVDAPTLTTATPPDSFARRSWSFSRSKSESVVSISDFSCLMRPLIASASPAPSMIVVESLSTTTRRALPSCESFVLSSLRPISSVMTSPPVRMAMSSSIRL